MFATRSCLVLCNSEDCSPPGSSVQGILQARILKWIPLSSPWDLPNPGVKPRSPALKAVYLLSKPPGKPSLSYTESKPTCSGLQGSYNLTSTSWSELICPLFSMMHSAFATWAFFLSLLQALRAPDLPELLHSIFPLPGISVNFVSLLNCVSAQILFPQNGSFCPFY